MEHPAHKFVREVEGMKFSRYPIQGMVLDAGCGDGLFSNSLLASKCVKFGVDLNAQRLKTAKNTLDFVVRGDLRLLPFKDEAFDFAVSNSTMEHVEGCSAALMELSRVSRNMLLCVPSSRTSNIRAICSFLKVVNQFTAEEWAEMSELCGFKIKECSYFFPLVSQVIYYFSLMFPVCEFIPKRFLKSWSRNCGNGVIAFIWGVSGV